ncbi:putative serine/threonine-protein kinase At1g09600 [Apium graveolens]|uniref:putative serine/threonine-protein kinase At1g09600 n=1 Tax=Apium graveolens TaxID=4045 RepID=UPI003D79F07F
MAQYAFRGYHPGFGRIPKGSEAELVGEGTYRHVYRDFDLENKKIIALKQIKVSDTKPETIRFLAREINILCRLDHPNIIKLEGLVALEISSNFCLVFEYMDHDLAGLASRPGVRFTEPQDIKGSNLLLDNNGNLKIADFGLGNYYDPQQVRPLTNGVVTLWYRPPELFLGATCYDGAIDLWSAGCILAELYVGLPIFPGKKEVHGF